MNIIKDLLINVLILTSFLSVSGHILRDKKLGRDADFSIKVLIVIIAGLLSIVQMLFSGHLKDSIIIDFRNIALIVTAVLSGLIPVIIVSVIIGVTSLLFLGISNTLILDFGSLLFIGLGCGLISRLKISQTKTWVYLVLFTLVLNTMYFSIFPTLSQLRSILISS